MISVFAPAKINLYLHVTGRRPDGYHLLDTIMVFCRDIGDVIWIEQSDTFEFETTGIFAAGLPKDEGNIVMRAAYELAGKCNKPLDLKIHLTKNMPLAAGLGGGSSDAAATVKALLEYWDIDEGQLVGLDEFLVSLGADVPACYKACSAHVTGIGDEISRFKIPAGMGVVLVNPLSESSTAEVFAGLSEDSFSGSVGTLPDVTDKLFFARGLGILHNDLYDAACAGNKDITKVINAIEDTQDCLLARMSGSGASCFGLYKDEAQAQSAVQQIKENHPNWWVVSSVLGGA